VNFTSKYKIKTAKLVAKLTAQIIPISQNKNQCFDNQQIS